MAENGGKILLVEDSPTQAMSVKDVLEHEGYDVVVAGDGIEGLAQFYSFEPDVVLLDGILPKMDGFEVCRTLKEGRNDRFTPVIMLTVRGDLSSKVTALDLGADDYLTKPFEPEELLARMRAALRIKRLEQKLRESSATDDLTGLYNRGFLMRRMEEELANAARHKTPLSCLMVDIDRFKRVNDTYGHQFGDEVLRRAAALARSCIRPGDVAARYGGEEFVLVLRDACTTAARSASERLRLRAAETVFAHGANRTRITISCGVACYPENVAKPSVDAVISAADSALYTAKRNGRNRTEIWQFQEKR